MVLSNTDPIGAARNKGVDNPKFAWYLEPTGIGLDRVFTEDENAVDPLSYSSFNPILISPEDIDTCQSAPAMTHKLFAHVSYEWKDEYVRWQPFAGFGAEVELAPKNRKYRAISQWGAWIKAGVAFQ